jgi:hypothetical protein
METTAGEVKADKLESADDRAEGLRPRLDELKRRIETLNDRAQGFIKEHPTACLLGALGLGYLCARIARRRS